MSDEEAAKVAEKLRKALKPLLARRQAQLRTEALAVNIAMNVVKDDKKRVLFVSLEMSTTALAKRILAGEIKFDSVSAKNGLFSTEERKRQEEKIKAAEAAYKSRKLIINDRVGHEISDVRALARREKRNEGGLDLVIVDYLQLMESREHSRQNNRQLVVGHISGQLKQMALELECPVLVLSQLSRNNENREDKRPQLSDLRDSGAIEQDADVVILLSDPNKGKADNGGSHDLREPKLISVNIAKNRNGNVRDDIKLNFHGNYTKFEELHASQ